MHQKVKFTPMKIHKTVATRAVPFGPDMHQIVCRLSAGASPQTPLEELTPPYLLAGLRGPTSKGGEGRKGEWREGKESPPLDLNPGDATAYHHVIARQNSVLLP